MNWEQGAMEVYGDEKLSFCNSNKHSQLFFVTEIACVNLQIKNEKN